MLKYQMQTAMRVFRRDLKLLIPYVGLLLGTGYLIYASGASLADSNVWIMFLSDSLKVGILGFIYFVFAAYEFSSRLRKDDGEEVILVEPGASFRILMANLLTLATLLFMWLILILSSHVIFFRVRQIAYLSYLTHAVWSVFCYCFCPGILAILLGISLKSLGRPVAFAFIAAFTLLSSPVPLDLFADTQSSSWTFPWFVDFFQWNVPNTGFYPDAVYGIPLEISRWCLAIFWIFLFGGLLLWKHKLKRRRFTVLLSILFLSISLTGLGRFLMRSNDSILQKDSRANGLVFGERNYRQMQEAGEIITADFDVLSYDLVFQFKNNLKATATLDLSEYNLDRYAFTLHHGLKVKIVLDEEGRALRFDRSGDYVDVHAPQGVQSITFVYEGQMGKYYANRQAVALPGYLAYYPMPGHISLWNYERNSYRIHDEFTESDFHVNILSSTTILSNLPRVGEQIFSGRSGTLSLFGGLIVDEMRAGQRYFHSPLSGQALTLDPASVQTAWSEMSSRVGLDTTFRLDDRLVIYQPMTFALDSTTEKFADLGDHVLVLASAPDAKSVAVDYILNQIPDHDDTKILKMMFEMYLMFDGTFAVEKPAYKDLEIILTYDPNVKTEENRMAWYAYTDAINIEFGDLYMYKMNELGVDYVCRAVFDYLAAETHLMNQVDFLYTLGDN